ncbi:MAG: glycosyltransferase 87 family protein [Ktedonobacterales bacterium]
MKQANAGATSSAPVRVPSWAYPLATVAGLLLGAEAIVRGTRAVVTISDSDLTNFFFRSAEYILNGNPWHMYAVRASGAYPNYNPPLSIFLMAPLLAMAHAIGFDKNYGELITFVCIPFMVFVPLLGYLVLRVFRQLYPEMPEAQRFLAYVLIVLSPLTWQTYGTWYHIEQPMMLCLLVGSMLALQQHHEGFAGLLAGLAVMTRTTALIPLIALGVLLLLGSEWRALFKLAGVGAAVVAAIMAPFFLVDRADTTYSFLTWRGGAPIGGNSIWTIFAAGNNATGLRHTIDAIARRLDEPSVILLVVVIAVVAARTQRISAYGRDAWAILAIAELAVPMLSKTNWPYYYLEPFVLLLIWEFSSMYDRRPGLWRWPVLSISFLATAATLSQYIGLESVGVLDRVVVGLLEFGAMAAFAVLVWLRLQAAKPASAVGRSYSPNLPVGIPGGVPPTTASVSPPRSVPTPPQPTVTPNWQRPPQAKAHGWESSSLGPTNAATATGSLPRDIPPWQQDGAASALPDHWPDLRHPADMGGGWPTLPPNSRQGPRSGTGQ